MLIFEHSQPGRLNYSQSPTIITKVTDIPQNLVRKIPCYIASASFETRVFITMPHYLCQAIKTVTDFEFYGLQGFLMCRYSR